MTMNRQKVFTVLALTVALAGCTNPHAEAMKAAMNVGKPPEATLNLRSLQTRRFESSSEAEILSASTQVLQDLGFTISESSSEAGVLTGAKQRDAEEVGAVAGQVALTIMFAALGTSYDAAWDKEQSIKVTLSVTPAPDGKQVDVRASFDRILTNNKGIQWRAEILSDAKIYQEFFLKLSQSVFLEAHET